MAGELGQAQDEIGARLFAWLPFARDAGLVAVA